MADKTIRNISICVFRKNDSILVFEDYDDVKEDYFYRPIGGGIEYGERSLDTLKREIYEEIRAEIGNIKLLDVIESVFTHNGRIGHEVVFVYDADFIDQSFYERTSFFGWKDDGSKIKLYWKRISEFENGNLRLVPEGLQKLL
ncbi:NUDIX hydrolase [Corticicoccus populi]|uniref:NUDIX hydrolase n=1 Tax=Corticicoccus populi TaxID=1812821 RepID=A0ABW5WWQ6_9STAP